MQTRSILSVAILSVTALSFTPFALAAHHAGGHDEMKKDAMDKAQTMKKDVMDEGKDMKNDAMVKSKAFHGGESTHVCTQGKLVRTIAVVYKKSPNKLPCEVEYTKNKGNTDTVYSANNTAGFCEAKAQELSKKLASSGWNCSVK